MALFLTPRQHGKPAIEECFFRLAVEEHRGTLIYGRAGVALSARGGDGWIRRPGADERLRSNGLRRRTRIGALRA